ncbi:unnamed protein product [Calicophoron daubneyi]|uniref:Uncharacterized protein n=1 Tax=Calicophoron daubneyi TaxID=300641 RepID=A0AAV2SY24_CALDB
MSGKISSSFALIVAIYLRLTFSRAIHISENSPSHLVVSPSEFGTPGNSNDRTETAIAIHDAITQIAFVCLSLSALCLCVTVICLNFRPRLLTRTKWRGKPKDEYSQSNQLYFSAVSTIHKEAVAFEESTLSSKQLCSKVMVQPYLTGPADGVKGTPKISNKTSVLKHDIFESTPIRDYHMIHEEVQYSKRPRSDGSRSSRSSLKLPIWAWKLIQYITDIGQSFKIKKPAVKTIATAKQPVTVSVMDTSKLDAHLPIVSWWKMSTGARSTPSSKREGAFIQEQKASGFAVVQKNEAEENEHASTVFSLRSKRYSTSSATTEENTNGEQLPISCETARNSELLSLASTADVIDPVYSRIRCSFDELVCDEDCGNGSAIHLVDHEQSCETCWQRGSYLSLTSEPSTHPSQHIYYELRKHSEAQRKNPDGCAPLDLADSPSAWSSQHLDQSHAANKCGRINPETPCTCYFETPPQLPARRYGESTVNLVNRLRSVLQSNYTRFSSTKRDFLDFWRKASTITGDLASPKSICKLEASTHSLANGSLTNGGRFNSCAGKLNCSINSPMRSKISGTRAGLTPQHLQSENVSSGHPVPAEDGNLNENLGEQLKSPNSGREVTIRMTLRKPVNSTEGLFAVTPISLPASGDDRCHTDHAEWATKNCPTRSVWAIEATESVSGYAVQKPNSAHGSTEPKFGGLRHIDSEVDLSDAGCPKHPATPERVYPRKQFYIQPSKPTSFLSQYQPELLGGTSIQEKCGDRMSNKSTASPSKSKNGFRIYPGVAYSTQSVNPVPALTMSPLMERSMEDEETRSTLHCVR